MPSTATTGHLPDATTGRTWSAALPLLIPPVAWIASLGLSWLVQDFTCTAAVTTGTPVSATALFVTLMVLNGVLLLITLGSGLASVRQLRSGRCAGEGLSTFLGGVGLLLALLFAFGIVLIGASPLILEIC